MGQLTYIAFAGSLACLALGLYVYLSNRQSPLHRHFFFICLSLSLLNMISLPAYTADTKKSLFAWTQAASFCVNAFYALNLHFYLALLIKKRLSYSTLIWVYLPALFIVVLYAINPLLILDYVRYGNQWKLIPHFNSIWFYVALGQVIAYVAATVVVIARIGMKASTNKEKLQMKWLVANLALSTLIGILGMWVIPWFKPDIQNVGPTYHLPYAAGLYLSVFRFEMMEFRPSIVADEIISHIGDMVFLLDPRLKVLSANARCREVIPFGANGPGGVDFSSLVLEGSDVMPALRGIGTGKGHSLRCRITYTGTGEPVETDSYLSRIMDRFNDIMGYLVISRENRGRRQFKTAYKITDRELEIIDLTLEGLSSRKIGEALGISERTVQSHQEHVYQKLGAEGKVDLVRIAGEFNVTGGRFTAG